MMLSCCGGFPGRCYVVAKKFWVVSRCFYPVWCVKSHSVDVSRVPLSMDQLVSGPAGEIGHLLKQQLILLNKHTRIGHLFKSIAQTMSNSSVLKLKPKIKLHLFTYASSSNPWTGI